MITKSEILIIVREHMSDCQGISQRDIDDHGERIAFRIERLVNKRGADESGAVAILRSMFTEHGEFEYDLGTLIKARAAIAKHDQQQPQAVVYPPIDWDRIEAAESGAWSADPRHDQ